MDTHRLADLIEANDPDGLVRAIDGLVAAREWGRLVDVRDRCLDAVARGKELWGVAAYAEYRLALDAPGSFAGAVIRESTQHGLGPLWEVAASTHRWDELDPYVAGVRSRTLVANERAVRGERLGNAADVDPEVLGTPAALAGFEPDYAVATYRADKVEAPEPEAAVARDSAQCSATESSGDDVVTEALYALVAPWVEESSGRALRAAVASAEPEAAVGALHPGRVRLARLSSGEALALMAWAGASGGVFGRRRGTAVGRSLAWWAAAAAADLLDGWPVDGDRLGAALPRLQWARFDPGPVGGWQLHLAVADPGRQRAWAVSAVDRGEAAAEMSAI